MKRTPKVALPKNATPRNKKPSIMFIPWENSGVGLYRLIIPMLSLAERKLAGVETIDEFSDDMTKWLRLI